MYVWGFKTTNQARAHETDFRLRACRVTLDLLQQVHNFTGGASPVAGGDYPTARGKTWFAVTKASFLGDVADALGGKVVTNRC